MSKKQEFHIIPLEELKRGYDLVIDNAVRCLGASNNLVSEYPDKALAIAQLGQEEIGKSLTLLSAAALPLEEEAWSWFWSGWRDHQLKGHRAYLYEIINPLRIEVPRSGGTHYSGLPLWKTISKEKEIGFYVDFNLINNVFETPAEQVDNVTAFCRMSTLTYLSATADAVRRVIFNADVDFRIREFGSIALKICSETIYQQDWPKIEIEFRAKSERHSAILDDLNIAVKGVWNFFKNTQKETK